jgi:hypothetical protein
MKILSLIILVFACTNVIAQKSLCSEQFIIGVKASLYINGYKQVQVIKKSNKGDLVFGLSDTSYKIVSFDCILPCPSRNLTLDIISKTFYGDRIEAEDKFLRSMIIGDQIYFECFIVEKNRIRYKITPLLFEVIE